MKNEHLSKERHHRGGLYIIGTVAGILSLVFSAPLRDAENLLASVAANANQVKIATLLILLMGLSLAMIPIVLYPILRRYNEMLALGYVIFRSALETVGCFVTPVIWLLLLALGQLYTQAGDAPASQVEDAAARRGNVRRTQAVSPTRHHTAHRIAGDGHVDQVRAAGQVVFV